MTAETRKSAEPPKRKDRAPERRVGRAEDGISPSGARRESAGGHDPQPRGRQDAARELETYEQPGASERDARAPADAPEGRTARDEP